MSEESPLNDKEDNANDEAHELDHSKISDSLNDDTGSNSEDVGSDEEDGKEDKESDTKESTVEVVFDSGGVKVSKKFSIMPGLQLMLQGDLEDEEEELENSDVEIEEESSVTPEEGDGKWLYY